MTTPLLILVTGLALVAVLWSGSLVLQSVLYESPVTGIAWRAPAAAAVPTALVALWCFIDYKNPRRYDTIFEFSRYDVKEFDKITSIKKRSDTTEVEVPFARRTDSRGRSEYRDKDGKTWARSQSGMVVAVVVEEGEKKTRFNAELTPDGKTFKVTENRPLRYNEERGGRYMTEDQIGRVITERTGVLLGNLLLNGLHFALWFVAFWTILRYSWSISLLLALAFWVLYTLIVLPLLFNRLREATPPAAVAHHRVWVEASAC